MNDSVKIAKEFMKKHLHLIVLISFLFSAYAQADVGSAKAYVKLFPIGDFVADIKGMKGTVQVNNGNYTVKDLSLDLNTFKSGLELRDNHAKDKYLEVKKFPTATLVEASGTNGKGSGKLMIRGVTKPVTGTYKIVGQNLTAEFKIKLSDYGIDEINYKGVGVEDEVRIEVTAPVVAMAAAPPATVAPKKVAPPAKAPTKAPLKPQPPKKK
jgi:polyisoprenoid-binding protein YceI